MARTSARCQSSQSSVKNSSSIPTIAFQCRMMQFNADHHCTIQNIAVLQCGNDNYSLMQNIAMLRLSADYLSLVNCRISQFNAEHSSSEQNIAVEFRTLQCHVLGTHYRCSMQEITVPRVWYQPSLFNAGNHSATCLVPTIAVPCRRSLCRVFGTLTLRRRWSGL